MDYNPTWVILGSTAVSVIMLPAQEATSVLVDRTLRPHDRERMTGRYTRAVLVAAGGAGFIDRLTGHG
jgi:hypothetical protein